MLRCAPALTLLSIAMLSFVSLVPFHVQAGSELEQRLRGQYDHKTLVLRNFYHGGRLSYDSAGSPANASAASGEWTMDGFVRVKSLDLSGQHLTIKADRLPVVNGGRSFQVNNEKENSLRIEVKFDPGAITGDKVDTALSRIFLTTQDRLANVVPDYWKPCVLAASTGQGGKQYHACSFPPGFSAIPGVVYSSQETPKSGEASSGESNISEGTMFRPGKGVSPPRVLSQAAPEFSEPARRAKYRGTVVLSLVVDKMGQVRNIRILSPVGFGLDQKAVEAVSKWKFDPGRKDGEPVAVLIAVEVDFHLY
jgi:TonB family protein